MPASRPDVAVYDKLAATGALGLTGATNLFRGPTREDEAAGVPVGYSAWVRTVGGSVQPYMGAAPQENFWRSTVNVWVRGARDAFDATQTKARLVLTTLHLADLTGYVACYAINGEPAYLGLDPTDHHQFLVQVELWYKE